jgi:glycosyltransferase involved in cell wall biosynthesis
MHPDKKCIFILGATRFDGPYESTSYTLAKEFAKNGHTVYYIEYPYTWIDAVRYRSTEPFKKRKPYFRGKNTGILDTGIPNLYIVVVPPLPSIHFLAEGSLYRKLLTLSERTIAKRLQRIIRSKGISEFTFINSFVFHYPNLAHYIKPALSIYHCVDPVITPYDIKHGLVSEKLVIEKSDIVVCTSKKLFDDKQQVHPKTYFIPNAADINHSIKATDSSMQVHHSLLNIPKPIIGYFGNIERRINYGLLEEVAASNRDKSFVFAGPVEKHLVPESFFSIPNVHFTGRVAYNEMPSVIKAFDVALIPFRKTNESQTVFPLKLFEYLGAAKPVVATDFNPDLEQFTEDLVAYCGTAKEFSDAINTALITDNDALRQQRINLAKEHTWDKRSAEFEHLIDQNLSSKLKPALL